MDDSDSNIDDEESDATKRHNEDQRHNENGQHERSEQHERHEQHERNEQDDVTNETASGPPDSPEHPHPQNSTDSPKSTCSVRSTNPGTPSSDGSLYDRYSVLPNALRIHRGDPHVPEDLAEVPQESTEHEQMRECVNAGMCILGRTQTRNVMATYSVGVVDFMESEYNLSTAGNMDVYGDGIQNAIGKWLEKLRGRFPDLYITPSIGSCYGYTERYNWGDHIDNYQPQPAADISIHPGVCSPTSSDLHLRC